MKNRKRYAALYAAALAGLMFLSGCEGQDPVKEPETAGCGENSTACETESSDRTEMTELSFQEAIDDLKEGKDGVYYFGFENCPWCKEAVPILKKEAEVASQTIYYIRTRDEEKNRLYTDEQREEIRPYIEDYMQEDENGVLSLYVPLVVRVRDGTVIGGHEGTVEGHDAKERTMTDDEKEELTRIYRRLLEE